MDGSAARNLYALVTFGVGAVQPLFSGGMVRRLDGGWACNLSLMWGDEGLRPVSDLQLMFLF